MVIDPSGHLAVKENRLDAMMHFAIARHSMYRQVYQHRVLLASETLNKAIAQRARELGPALNFADPHMKLVLSAKTSLDLPLTTIFALRESWWKYHLFQWSQDQDPILSDLCDRLLSRRLLKTVRVRSEDDREKLLLEAEDAVRKAKFDPRFYLHEITSSDMHAGELQQPMMVQMDNGRLEPLQKSEPLWNAMVTESKKLDRSWLVMPEEAKKQLGRER